MAKLISMLTFLVALILISLFISPTTAGISEPHRDVIPRRRIKRSSKTLRQRAPVYALKRQSPVDFGRAPSWATKLPGDFSNSVGRESELGQEFSGCVHLLDGASFSGTPFNDTPFNSTSLNGTPFNGTLFNGTSFNGTSFNGTPFNGTLFNGSSFNGTSFNGTPFNGTSFNGTPFNGTLFNGTSFNSTSFNGIPFNGTLFNGAPFNGTLFNGTSFKGTSFNGTPFNGTSSNDTTSNGAPSNGASLHDSAPTYADILDAAMQLENKGSLTCVPPQGLGNQTEHHCYPLAESGTAGIYFCGAPGKDIDCSSIAEAVLAFNPVCVVRKGSDFRARGSVALLPEGYPEDISHLTFVVIDGPGLYGDV